MWLAKLAMTLILGASATAALAGGVRVEHWKGIPGAEITDTLSDAQLDRPADEARQLNGDFEAQFDEPAPSALAVRAIVRVPRDGVYRFAVAGRDTALLFLSLTGMPKDREQVALVPGGGDRCDFFRYEAQRSPLIWLYAGQRVLVEVYAKYAAGKGHVEVGWTLPEGQMEGPIPSQYLEPAPVVSRPPIYEMLNVKVALKPDTQAATTPGHHKFPAGATVKADGKTFDLSYLLYLPVDYDKTNDPKALFVFLHGNGHQGSDLYGILNEGPAQNLNDRPELRQWFPMVALFPQLPYGWRWDTPGAGATVARLVDAVCEKYPRIDRNRVYLSGLSMGGKGTWITALASPDTFAAIAPISAVSVRPKVATTRLKQMNTWIICGANDWQFTAGSKEMYQTLQPVLNDKVKLSVIENEGHTVWNRYYPTKEFYQQLMAYRKP